MGRQKTIQINLSHDYIKRLLITRICPRCGKRFVDLAVRKKEGREYLLSIHYEGMEKKKDGRLAPKLTQCHLGKIEDHTIKDLIEQYDPVRKIRDTLRDKGLAEDAIIDICDTISQSLDVCRVTDEKKKVLIEKLNEIKNKVLN